jgi:hypothetical protein
MRLQADRPGHRCPLQPSAQSALADLLNAPERGSHFGPAERLAIAP